MDISRLRGELQSARAMLDVNLSGEKEAIIRQAREQVALSKEKSLVQKKVLERQKELYEKELISIETYEIEAGKTRIYELEATMALAQQEALESGAKPEYLFYLKSEIQSRENMLQVLEERKKRFSLLAPLSGRIYQSFSNDTLIVIGDTVCTVLIALPSPYKNEIETGTAFSFEMMNGQENQSGTIVKINSMVKILSGQQFYICTGIISEIIENIPFNLVVQCHIEAKSKSVIDYLKPFIKALIN